MSKSFGVTAGMMKQLLRWGATLGIIGSTFLAGSNLAALALPKDQVLGKLNPVPVFTVADAQGAPLIATGQDNAKVAGVFISQKDAQAFIDKLKKENPDLGSKVQVVPVSLGEVYQLEEQNQGKKDGLNFAYVPVASEVEEAKKILEQNKQKYQGGVPLFVAKGGDNQGYLTIQKDNKEVIPFFFDKAQADQMIARFKEQKPDLAGSIKIDVVILEGVITALAKNDDELLTKIVLWPTEETIEFIRSTAPKQPDSTAPQPSKPSK
jgi:hypothetical protein